MLPPCLRAFRPGMNNLPLALFFRLIQPLIHFLHERLCVQDAGGIEFIYTDGGGNTQAHAGGGALDVLVPASGNFNRVAKGGRGQNNSKLVSRSGRRNPSAALWPSSGGLF